MMFSLGIAVVLLTIAFPLQLDGYSVAIAWAAQGGMFVWIGFYLGRWQTRLAGLAVLALAVAHLLTFDVWVDLDEFRLGLNGRFLTTVIVIVGFYWRDRDVEVGLEGEKSALPILLGIPNLTTLGLFSLEMKQGGDYFSATHLSLTVLWAMYAMGVISAGIAVRSRWVRLSAMGLLATPVAKLFVFEVFLLEIEYRVAAFVTWVSCCSPWTLCTSVTAARSGDSYWGAVSDRTIVLG